MLLLTVNEAKGQQVGLKLDCCSAKTIGKGIKRVEFLVAKQHIDARNEYGRIARKVVHN